MRQVVRSVLSVIIAAHSELIQSHNKYLKCRPFEDSYSPYIDGSEVIRELNVRTESKREKVLYTVTRDMYIYGALSPRDVATTCVCHPRFSPEQLQRWTRHLLRFLTHMNKTSNILYQVSRVNWKAVERISWEVMLHVRSWTVFTSSHSSTLEQRKAALRRVEIELDEADDIVCFLSRVWRWHIS